MRPFPIFCCTFPPAPKPWSHPLQLFPLHTVFPLGAGIAGRRPKHFYLSVWPNYLRFALVCPASRSCRRPSSTAPSTRSLRPGLRWPKRSPPWTRPRKASVRSCWPRLLTRSPRPRPSLSPMQSPRSRLYVNIQRCASLRWKTSNQTDQSSPSAAPNLWSLQWAYQTPGRTNSCSLRNECPCTRT